MPRFHVDRSIEIGASPQRVFETVTDFGTWTTWSPWLIAEPDAQVTVTPNSAAVGSVYAWNGQVTGQGEIEHLQLVPGELILDEIRFLKPFRSVSSVSFRMEPAGEGTRLTWNMDGSLPWFMFWMKGMMQTMIGMDYDRGLKMLKEWMETGSISSRTVVRGVETIGPLRVAGIRAICSIDDVGPSMKKSFSEAAAAFRKHNLPMDGEMISVYHKFDMKARTFDYTSGYAIPSSADAVPAELSEWSIPTLKAFCVDHIGSYDHLGNGWSAANQIARYKKMKQCRVGTFEIYRTTPDDTPEAELKTEIYLPLK